MLIHDLQRRPVRLWGTLGEGNRLVTLIEAFANSNDRGTVDSPFCHACFPCVSRLPPVPLNTL